jgi:hypothetical protein
MPHQTTVTETYWCPGPWPWQWFDTCHRRVTKWCYDFSWVEETGYFFFSHDRGCENGILYSWYAFSFGIVGSTYYGAGEMCFDSQLGSDGRCFGDAVRANVVANASVPRLQASARRRIRLPIRHQTVSDQEERSDGADQR